MDECALTQHTAHIGV